MELGHHSKLMMNRYVSSDHWDSLRNFVMHNK